MDSFTRITDELKGTVLEFFLGKNIIAKIAIFLLFLGVLSFGQLAYVDWLDDIGRMVFIGSIGAVMMVIAYYFERCKSIVFSNVFYVLGIALWLLTIMLGHYSYHLFSIDILLIEMIVLMILSFVFISYRRTEFLDASMLVLYSIILTVPYGLIYHGYTNLELLLATVIITIYTGIFFLYWTSDYHNQTHMRTVLFVIFIFSIRGSIPNIGIPFYRYNSYTIQLLYITQSVVILYGMLLTLPSISYKILQWGMSIVGIYFLGSIVLSFIVILEELYGSLHTISSITIGWIIIYTPLHIWYTRKRDIILSVFYLIALMIGVVGLSVIGGDQFFDFYKIQTLNWISIALVLVFILCFILTHKKQYYISAAIVQFVITFRAIIYMVSMHRMNFSNLDLFIPSLLIAIVFTFVPRVLQKEAKVDSFILYGLTNMLASSILIVFVFVNEWTHFNSIIYVAFAALILIGYRYLLDLPILKNRFTNITKQLVQGKIIFVIFVMNFYYFDHNLSDWGDIQFLLLTMLLNGYIIISFKELYTWTNMDLDIELKFIIFYIMGAIIQSIWIHRYINVEFDKVILSSYFMIASAIGILIGFRHNWEIARKVGLGVIYFSLFKFFIYDFFTQDFTTTVRMITYFILGFTLLGISFLYSYLEKTYGNQ